MVASGDAQAARSISTLLSHCARAALIALPAATLLAAITPMTASAGPVTVNPVQNTTYTLSAAGNPITFGPGTNINAPGDAVDGDLSANWIVTNTGALTGASGLVLQSSSTVTNQASGTISSTSSNSFGTYGVFIGGASGAVTNGGAISAAGFAAIYYAGGGTVANAAGGSISNASNGVWANGGPLTVTNAGLIYGQHEGLVTTTGGAGNLTNQPGGVINSAEVDVTFNGGGTVVNQAGASLTAGLAAIEIDGGPANVVNAGTISTTNPFFGAVMIVNGASGNVVNEAGGVISGAQTGVYIDHGTVTNAGTIAGSIRSIQFTGTGANTLILQNGSVLNGPAEGSQAAGATNALVLQGSGEADNLFLNFNTLEVQGPGPWTLTAPASIGATDVVGGSLIVTDALTSATTDINGGSLQVGDASHAGATLTGAVNVHAGATLTGFGVIVGSVTNNGGAVAPGRLGQLTIQGSYAQSAAGTLAVTVAPSSGSSLKVTGAATLGGQLVLVTDPGVYRKGQSYAVLTAGSLAGGFSSVSATNGLDVGVSASATDVTATVLKGNFSVVGASANESALAAAFNNYPVGVSDFDQVANALIGLPEARQNAALDMLGGEVDADFLTVARDSFREVIGNLSARVTSNALSGDGDAPKVGKALWGQAFGDFGRVDGDGDAHGVSHAGEGGVIGVQYGWDRDASVGAAVSFDHVSLNLRGLPQEGNFDSASFNLYGERRWGMAFVDGAASVAYDHGSSSRIIALPGVSRRATGSFDGYLAGVWAAMGVRWVVPDGVRVEPSVDLTYDYADQGGFTESGAGGADLMVDRAHQSATQGTIGVRVSKVFAAQTGALTIGARVAEAHDFARVTPHINESFAAAPGTGFTLNGADPGMDFTLVSLDLDYKTTSRLSVFARYGGAFGLRQTDNTFTVGGQVSF